MFNSAKAEKWKGNDTYEKVILYISICLLTFQPFWIVFYCAQGRRVSQATINNGIDGQEIGDRSRVQLSICETKTHTKKFHAVKFNTQACMKTSPEKPKPKTKAPGPEMRLAM